jgi:hypothetical protein
MERQQFSRQCWKAPGVATRPSGLRAPNLALGRDQASLMLTSNNCICTWLEVTSAAKLKTEP